MKRENLYLILSILLFILLIAVIYDRFTLSNELDTLNSSIIQIKEESQK